MQPHIYIAMDAFCRSSRAALSKQSWLHSLSMFAYTRWCVWRAMQFGFAARTSAASDSRDNKAVACRYVWNVARKYIAGQNIASLGVSMTLSRSETHIGACSRQTHPYYDYVYLAVTLSNRTHSLHASQNTESARSKAARPHQLHKGMLWELGNRESNSDFSCRRRRLSTFVKCLFVWSAFVRSTSDG